MKVSIQFTLACLWLCACMFQSQSVNGQLPGDSGKQDQDFQVDQVLIKTREGTTISAMVVRNKNFRKRMPTTLFYTIYADPERNLKEAKLAAAKGYVGMVANTRGKGLSPDPVEPYEGDAQDIYGVIDWISKQDWSDGQVGMYGGSYSGYAAWAATKKLHPALKTIVPYVAAIPGQGLPMENNVFLNANYGWAFYVGNNKYLDTTNYYNRKYWWDMQWNWYASGKSYRKIDSIEGRPNKLLQRWLDHPAYDKYWQDKVPYQQDYVHINIPVLSITGYYDDGQISALHYFKEHYRYLKQANHYLVIGPYNHFGAQKGNEPTVNGYEVDPVARIHTRDLTFEWMDYVMKGRKKPALLQDKVNYEVMGANVWRHVPSIAAMSNRRLKFYLHAVRTDSSWLLSSLKPRETGFVTQEVNFADRTTQHNDYYPYPIIRETKPATGLCFVSAPFTEAVAVDGLFSGELRLRLNKKDLDIGVVLYEVMPDGRYFHLSYYLGRASYAKDMSRRELLQPGEICIIPFSRTRMVSRQLRKGSRLMVMIDVNKNPGAQLNYGTGKDVSEETIADAKVPLKIEWLNDSYVEIPIRNN